MLNFTFSNRAAFHILNFNISSNFQLLVGFRVGLFAIAWTSAGKRLLSNLRKRSFKFFKAAVRHRGF